MLPRQDSPQTRYVPLFYPYSLVCLGDWDEAALVGEDDVFSSGEERIRSIEFGLKKLVYIAASGAPLGRIGVCVYSERMRVAYETARQTLPEEAREKMLVTFDHR
jgi:hypothetical protein